MLEEYWVDGESNPCIGIILTVGFLPGLKVDAIPLFQPRKVTKLQFVKMMFSIGFFIFYCAELNCSAALSLIWERKWGQ